MVPVIGAALITRKLTEDQNQALREFATLGISVGEFLSRMRDLIVVGEFVPAQREISVAAMPNDVVAISRDDVRWVVQRYLHGKTTGEELSNWAGLLLAIPAFSLPTDDRDDTVLELLNDLALPLKNEYLDRNRLKQRIDEI